jgi:hypothetical protein
MYIRSIKDQTMTVGGGPYGDKAGKSILYPTAWPFSATGTPICAVTMHGYNGAVTTLADLWPQNIVRTLPTAGFTIGVSSSSASDAAAGTGARTIEVDCLGTDFVPHTYTYTLNGQTKVTDTNLVGGALRINDIRIKSWGSGLQNAGDIYVYDASDTVTAGVPQTATKIFHRIAATANTARGGFYTVPAGCQLQTGQFRGGFNDSVNNPRAGFLSFKYLLNNPVGQIPTFFPLTGQINNYVPQIVVQPDHYVIIDEKTDLVLQCTSSVSGVVVAFLDAILYQK